MSKQVKPPKKKLNAKQEMFCREFVIDLNATQAAIRAGYSAKTAYSIGQRLLKKVEIQHFLQKLKEKREKRTEISADKTVKELAKMAYLDPRKFFNEDGSLKETKDLDDETAASLSFQKVKVADKLAALRDLGKHQGIYEKDNEQKGNADLKTKQEFMEGLLESIAKSDRGLPKE